MWVTEMDYYCAFHKHANSEVQSYNQLQKYLRHCTVFIALFVLSSSNGR